MEHAIESAMIAPCGMICTVCLARLREKKRCPGCNGSDADKPPYCIKCIIKNCGHRQQSADYCYSCAHFPCARLKNLDKRYRTKYAMSMIENLRFIQERGMDAFLRKETESRTCPTCGGWICIHRGFCLPCNKKEKQKDAN